MRALTSHLSSDWSQRPLFSDWSSISWNKSLFELFKKYSHVFLDLKKSDTAVKIRNVNYRQSKCWGCSTHHEVADRSANQRVIFEFSHDSGASETSITSSVANERLHQNLETLPKNTIGKKIPVTKKGWIGRLRSLSISLIIQNLLNLPVNKKKTD